MGADLSYGRLHALACGLAQRLIALGVQPGDRVAIAMTKGLEMPVAIHAIWMAGAAFVPLDPKAPLQRQTTLIDNCSITCILSAPRNADLAQTLAEASGARAEMVSLDAAGATGFEPARTPEDALAYIIFTSGSTGTPKGICHTHASGRAFAEAWQAVYDAGPEDVFFSTVPLHFDFSLADFFVPAHVGAMTELVAEPLLAFPASLAAHLETSGGTIWSSVPHTFIQLCERGAVQTRDLGCLRWLIYGGEPMPASALPLLRETFTGAAISNSYGPAETNQVIEYTVPADHPPSKPIPIGHPMSHAGLHIDDMGELLVAAPSMMQGYWQRPDLNDAAFADIAGVRHYRTGDRVALGEDGLWQFLGRRDRLVKIRGFRIELDEVELALVSHDAVAEAAAVVPEDKQTLRVFATLHPGAEHATDEAALRRYLADLLPPYAVPERITIRAALEKTSTGKINRNVLTTETT